MFDDALDRAVTPALSRPSGSPGSSDHGRRDGQLHELDLQLAQLVQVLLLRQARDGLMTYFGFRP
jgi:hypothetical protein